MKGQVRRPSLLLCALLLWAPLLAARTEPARITAKKGAVSLSLSVRSTIIKAGDVPEFRIELKNIGRKRFAVTRDLYTEPNRLERNWHGNIGTFVQVLGSDGKQLRPDLRFEDRWTLAPFPCPESERAAKDQIAAWKLEGLSDQVIDQRLASWPMPPCPGATDPAEAVLVVQPGDSLFFPGPKSESFALLSDFRASFRNPGTYKIRAVYDMKPTKDLEADYAKGLGQRMPNEIRLTTGWISVESK